jgi:hypothetical protein
MKKALLSFVALSLASLVSTAQEFYFRAGTGYAAPQAGQTLDGTGQPYNGTLSSNNTYNVKNASFSSGVQGYLGLGYMFSDHVGVQVDANLGLANTKYTFTASDVYVGGILSTVSIVQQAKSPVIVTPALVLQTGGDAVNVYARIGLALPVSTKITQDQILTNAPGTGSISTDDFTLQLTNSFSMGFTGAAGVKYRINEKFTIWGELSFMSMSLYLKEAELTGASENGQSIPLSQIVGAQVVKYSKNATVDSTNTTQVTYSQPFSNVGINVGINISLSNSGGHSRHNVRGNDDIDRPRSGKFH